MNWKGTDGGEEGTRRLSRLAGRDGAGAGWDDFLEILLCMQQNQKIRGRGLYCKEVVKKRNYMRRLAEFPQELYTQENKPSNTNTKQENEKTECPPVSGLAPVGGFLT
jgi:hypothetical protein